MIAALARAVPILLVLVAGPSVDDAAAQTRITGADARGRVVDATGGVLPGATLTAAHQDTNLQRVAVADSEGRYLIAALSPGRYELIAELSGFQTQRLSIDLVVGQEATVDFTLSVLVEEIVQVVDGTPVLDADRSSIGFVVAQREIERLPINGRNFISFAALTPGVTPTDDTLPGAGTSGLSFLGQRPRSNNILVDGLDNNDRELGAALVSFSQEAVREFQVLTGNYAAEFGFATAGVINIVTRSGTNAWQGSAFGYLRDRRLNAKGYFDRYDVFGSAIERDEPGFRQSQTGATAGGPLRRDRTFIFGSVERLDVRAHNIVTIDPATAAALTSAGVPVQTGPAPYAIGATQALAKLGQHWTANRSTMARVQFSNVDNENYGNERPGTSGRQSFGGSEARSHGAEQRRSDVAGSVSQLDIVRRLVNDLSVQFAVENQRTYALDPTCAGRCDDEREGTPEVTVLGAAVAGGHQFEPTSRRSARLQVKNTTSYAAGAHLIKSGVDYIHLDQVSRIPLVFRGAYYFSALPAIPGLFPAPLSSTDAVALGVPVLYIQGYGDSRSEFTHHDLAVFAQDDWRVSPRLTVRAGLRYQVQIWPSRMVTVSDVGGGAYEYGFPADRNNLALRLSAAHDLGGQGRTSLRGGYGRFYGDQLTRLAASTLAHDGRDGVRIRLVNFPDSIAAWRAPDRRLPESQAFASSTVAIGPDVESPTSDQVTAGLSHVVGGGHVLSADVVWLRGRHYVGALNYNPLVPALGVGRRPNDVGGVPGTSAEVFQFTDFGESWYRGLLLSWSQRASSRVDVRASYTWSRAEDNSSVFLAHVQDSGRGRNPADRAGLPLGFDPSSERGPAPHDRPHRAVVASSLLLPAGFATSLIVSAHSGAPFTPLAGVDLNGDGLPLADRARRHPADASSSVGRNSERLPAEFTVDARASRRTGIGGTRQLELIAEVFNVFNRTNFAEVNETFGAGTFPGDPQRDASGRVTYGRFTRALAPRQAQLAVRLLF